MAPALEAGLSLGSSHPIVRTGALVAALIAFMLGGAALSARLVADQVGHSRPSMTQDVYLGRRAVDSQAALALETALRDAVLRDEKHGKAWPKKKASSRGGR